MDENNQPADTRTYAQRCALLDLLRQLKCDYPKARIVGHYQLSPYIRKTCPCFDAIKEYEALDQPNASAIRLTTHGPS